MTSRWPNKFYCYNWFFNKKLNSWHTWQLVKFSQRKKNRVCHEFYLLLKQLLHLKTHCMRNMSQHQFISKIKCVKTNLNISRLTEVNYEVGTHSCRDEVSELLVIFLHERHKFWWCVWFIYDFWNLFFLPDVFILKNSKPTPIKKWPFGPGKLRVIFKRRSNFK